MADVLSRELITRRAALDAGETPYPSTPELAACRALIATDPSPQDILKDLDEGRRCLLDEASSEDLVLEFTPDAAGPESTGGGHVKAKDKGGSGAARHASRIVGPGHKGLYVLLYVGCKSGGDAGEAKGPGLAIDGSSGDGSRTGRHLTSFKLRVVFWNQATGGVPDYLSAGSEPLPKLFFAMFLMFLGALAVWVQCLRRHPAQVKV